MVFNGGNGYPGPTGPSTQTASTLPRLLSADGTRVFFQTAEALVSGDTNSVNDVYEWEAPGSGSCEVGSSAYSGGNRGCLYLLSPANSLLPSYFADASDVEDLTAQISYDDGDTWTSVPARRLEDGRYRVTVQQPEGSTAGFVSLRIDATDADQSRIRQTIVRAYGLKG